MAMAQLGKADLEQMGEEYFRSLESERLVEVAKNLYELAVEQLEKLEQTSKTSSRPPSSDSPYQSSSVSQEEGTKGVEALVSGEKEEGEDKDQQKTEPGSEGNKEQGTTEPGSKGNNHQPESS